MGPWTGTIAAYGGRSRTRGSSSGSLVHALTCQVPLSVLAFLRTAWKVRDGKLTVSRFPGSGYLHPSYEVEKDSKGRLMARCRRCSELFNINNNSVYSCGYHPGELGVEGYSCCGVIPRPGTPAVFCHWRPHAA